MTTNAIDKAYDLGFKHCAINWAERGDLVADIGSPTYAKDKNYVLAALDASVKVPDELDQDVEDFGSSMYAAGWNAFRDALLSAQEAGATIRPAREVYENAAKEILNSPVRRSVKEPS